MSKTIRIDKEVEAVLKKEAKAFETPNQVLRRLLKIKDKKVVDSKK